MNMTTEANGKITLYAVWEIITTNPYEYEDFGFNFGYLGGGIERNVRLTDIFDIEGLIAEGYKNFEMEVSFKLRTDDNTYVDIYGYYGYLKDNTIYNTNLFNDSDMKVYTTTLDYYNHKAGETASLREGNDYFGIGIYIKGSGIFDYYNNGAVLGLKYSIRFYK